MLVEKGKTMKVTSNIREYIKEEIARILDSKVNPYTEQAKIDEKMIENFCKELRDTQNDMINQFIEENELMDSWRGRNTKYIASISTPSLGRAVTPTMLKAKEWEEENQKYKATKTREIIAKLELGANRSELEEMLAELASQM